jgi:hypothetical protein
VVGVLFLGDTTRRGLTAVAVAGFALAVVCAVQLARFGEATEGKIETDTPGQLEAAADSHSSTAV